MRTVFARLIALGALGLVVGCSGNSTNPLPVTGGINGTGGSPGGAVSGNTTTSPGQTTTPSSSTDTRSSTPSATGASFIFATGAAGAQVTVQMPVSSGFAFTPNASGSVTAQLTQQLTAYAGVAALSLPLPANGASTPTVIQYFQLTVTSGTVTATKSPNFIITLPALPAGHSGVSLAATNAAGAWSVPLAACTVTIDVVNCPATTQTYPAAGVPTYAIYAT